MEINSTRVSGLPHQSNFGNRSPSVGDPSAPRSPDQYFAQSKQAPRSIRQLSSVLSDGLSGFQKTSSSFGILDPIEDTQVLHEFNSTNVQGVEHGLNLSPKRNLPQPHIIPFRSSEIDSGSTILDDDFLDIENHNSLTGEDNEKTLICPKSNATDIISDLFPELQSYPESVSDLDGTINNLDNNNEPLNYIHIAPTKAEPDRTALETDDSGTGFFQVPWGLSQPHLSDLSLLSNDEMDLELERFGYNTPAAARDIPVGSGEEGIASIQNEPSDRAFLPSPRSELGHFIGSRNQEIYLTDIALPQKWSHSSSYERNPTLHSLDKNHSHRVGMTADNSNHAVSLPQSEIFNRLHSQIEGYPYKRMQSSALAYIDRSGMIREACCCEFKETPTNMNHVQACSETERSFHPHSPLEPVQDLVASQEYMNNDFPHSPYPYARTGLYRTPMQLHYVEGQNPLYESYCFGETDVNSIYTISRPSSCTISRSVSAQSETFLRGHDTPLSNSFPEQAVQGSSPEWTPPSTPLYVHFQSTYNFGAQADSSQNPGWAQQFHNQHENYRSMAPVSSGYTQSPSTENEVRSPPQITSNSTVARQDNNELLVQLRDQGISYKEIKRRLNCPEAESTLRGRHRTLTKDKSQRVRKPVWTDNDIRILINCVTGLILSPQGAHSTEEKETGCKVSARWKYISEEILKCGGSYKFGPGTCKKKYKELVEMGSAPAIQELEKRKGHRTGDTRDERCVRLRGRRKNARRITKPRCSSK